MLYVESGVAESETSVTCRVVNGMMIGDRHQLGMVQLRQTSFRTVGSAMFDGYWIFGFSNQMITSALYLYKGRVPARPKVFLGTIDNINESWA